MLSRPVCAGPSCRVLFMEVSCEFSVILLIELSHAAPDFPIELFCAVVSCAVCFECAVCVCVCDTCGMF